MNTLPELKEEELRAFFQENNDNIVGKSVSAYYCPITRFYKEKYGMDVTTVRTYIKFYRPNKEPQHKRVHPWVTSFIRMLDNLYGHRYVTGAQSLEVLDRAIIESKGEEIS